MRGFVETAPSRLISRWAAELEAGTRELLSGTWAEEAAVSLAVVGNAGGVVDRVAEGKCPALRETSRTYGYNR
jgi:hypothetical protein